MAILPRTIQFFTPGVPQVYYVGLLAGKNNMESAKGSIDGREINRHNFSVKEIDRAVRKPVVQRLLRLIRFRNEYPAFNGRFEILESDKNTLNLSWEKDENFCQLNVDLKTNFAVIKYRNENQKLKKYVV